MFSLHDFLMVGLRDAVGKMADYQVILNAVGWQQKGVLADGDLAELNALIDAKNAPPIVEDDSAAELDNTGVQI